MYIEHKFRTLEAARQAQTKLRKTYGYTPEVFKVTDPFLKITFYVVIEPTEAVPV